MAIFAKKSLGQHFLNSRHVLDQIISAAQIKTGQTVLEIGPGTGVLTEALLIAGASVIAIEKDNVTYDILCTKFFKEIESGRLKLFHDDILNPDLFTKANNSTTSGSEPSLISHFSSPHSFSLVANIPYYITGAILEKFLEHGPRPDKMVLLVQKEVAERIIARDGKESVLSISVKAFGTPRMIAKVPPGAFTPPPTVDSAILEINDISAKLFSQKQEDGHDGIAAEGAESVATKGFFEIVKAGFAHKRKFLIRNLETVIPAEKLALKWEELKLDPKARAEDLNVEDWLRLAE